MAYPEDIRPITVELLINGEWIDISSYVLYARAGTINRGAGGEDDVMPPSTLTLELKNPDGRFSQDNPESPYWPWLQQSTQIRYRITDNAVVFPRYYGEVADWPEEIGDVPADSTVAVEAGGWFRRWERSEPLESPLRRTLSVADTLVAYWPMEDEGANAQSLASGLPGKPAMVIKSAVDVAAYSGFEASNPIVSTQDGRVTGSIAPHAATGQYLFYFLFNTNGVAVTNITVASFGFTGGSVARVGIEASTAGDLQVAFFDSFGTLISTSGYDGAFAVNDLDVLVVFDVLNNGSNVDWILSVFTEGEPGTVADWSETVAGRQIGHAASTTFGYLNDLDSNVGHAAVFTGPPNNQADILAAFHAYRGETAGDRYLRVCGENGIDARIIGDPADTPLMGAQPVGTVKAILQECAETTHGLIFENRDSLGITFLTLEAMYNQTADTRLGPDIPIVANSVATDLIRVDPSVALFFYPGVTFKLHQVSDDSLTEATLFTVTTVYEDYSPSEIGIEFTPAAAVLPTTAQKVVIYRGALLALDYAASELGKPFKPRRDDRLVANDVTVTRRGGSQFRAREETGPRSVLEPPNGIGVFPDPVTLNLHSDGQLAEHATWLLGLGTSREARFPDMSVELHRASLTARQAEVLTLDIGWLVTVDNAANAWMFDQIRQIVRGYVEVFDGNRLHSIDLNTVPARQYEVLTFDDDDHRWCADTTVLAEAITSTQTGAVDVAVGADVWTTAASEFPMDIMIGGERVTLSGISGGAASITFVGVGTPAAGDNASVAPGLPTGSTSGDVVLILASIRGIAGDVGIPANWVDVGGFDGFRILAREYDGVWTMPTVTFTGGAAGDTTLGQSCAFRGIGTTALVGPDRTTVVSGSNILARSDGMAAVIGQYGLRLACGRRGDDWTSVTPPAGLVEIEETDSTLGNDAGQTWAYALDSSSAYWPTSGSPGTFTVTGGGAARCDALVTFFPAAPQVFTISARSVNGVVKPHAVGASVDVAEPKTYGL